jgi:hypothetical protein
MDVMLTLASNTALGDGVAPDRVRTLSAPRHWAYFSFGHKLPPYDSTARLLKLQQCASCHVRIAADNRLCGVMCAYRAGTEH